MLHSAFCAAPVSKNLVQFQFCMFIAFTGPQWQYCCIVGAFIHCGHCLDRRGGAQLQREKLRAVDKL